jgi:hypothetical protein
VFFAFGRIFAVQIKKLITAMANLRFAVLLQRQCTYDPSSERYVLADLDDRNDTFSWFPSHSYGYPDS